MDHGYLEHWNLGTLSKPDKWKGLMARNPVDCTEQDYKDLQPLER